MRDFRRQIEKIEKRLNVNAEPDIVEIVMFNDGDLPPEHTVGSTTIRHVHYADIQKKAGAEKG